MTIRDGQAPVTAEDDAAPEHVDDVPTARVRILSDAELLEELSQHAEHGQGPRSTTERKGVRRWAS